MQREFNGRLISVIVIFVLAGLMIVPSIDYFLTLGRTPYPRREQFATQDDFTSATAQYQAFMTQKRQGMKLLGRPMPLGLDLQGGVDVLLSVSREQTIQDQLRLKSRDIVAELRKEELAATVELTEAGDAIRIRLDSADTAENVALVLSDFKDWFQSFDADDLRDTQAGLLLRFNEGVADDYVGKAIGSAMEVVTRRVDELGVTAPTVVRVGAGMIRVQVPGESDPQRVIDNVIRPARLEFRLVHPDQDRLIHQDLQFDEYGEIIGGQLPSRYVKMNGEPQEPHQKSPQGNKFEIKVKTAARGEETRTVGYYIVEREPSLTGDNLADARYYYNPQNVGQSPHEVNITFDRKGTAVFRNLTREHLNEDMAIILESYVESAPELVAHITDGRARITGRFTPEEAQDLSLVLRAGALPATLKVEHQQTVGASLGADSIRQSMEALLIGSTLVVIFMLAYYFGGGVVTVLALTLNVMIIFAVLALSRATLTLSGIGGLLLTVGMAVDANILIFERMREEFRATSSLKVAINKGFGKAFSTIFDANVTTLVTALILLQFGTPTMQGFALTMTFGIFTTLFTGLYVSRTLCDTWSANHDSLSLGRFKLLDNPGINFIKLRYAAYALSGVLLLAGIGGIIHNRGLNLGVDFQGGVVSTVEFANEALTESDIRKALTTDIKVQHVIGTRQFLLTSKYLAAGGDVNETGKVIEGYLKSSSLGGFTILGVDGVSSVVGGQFKTKTLVCIFVSALCILLYVWFRFELAFGAAAVLMLFHDIVLTLGLLEIMEIEVSLEVVAALLMVFGYSINDTIVVFDRIRENMQSMFGRHIEDLINISINQTLGRTLMTSITTLLAIVSMIFLGGKGLFDFSLTLLIGIIIGTYSTDFIAAPVLYEWRKRRPTAALRPAEEGETHSTSADEGSEAGRKKNDGPRTRGVRVEPIR